MREDYLDRIAAIRRPRREPIGREHDFALHREAAKYDRRRHGL